jgi:hypothetical protein
VAVHPGIVATELAVGFFKEQGLLPPNSPVQLPRAVTHGIVDGLAPLMLKRPAASAATMGVAALAPAARLAGGYVVNGRPAAPAVEARDAALAAQLWDTAQRLTGLDAIPPSLLRVQVQATPAKHAAQ